ncbi:hypothetical protein CRYUN_Cryun05aG0198500 [Craigia yunnanensis]
MEDLKKRKMEEMGNNGELSTQEELRSFLDPVAKSQLVDFLSRLYVHFSFNISISYQKPKGSQYPSIAEEIKSIARSDPVHRKLFFRGLAWNTTSETLCAVSALLIAVCLFCDIGVIAPHDIQFWAFRMHGEIEGGAVIYDKATGKSRGYGFITYKRMESAHSALRAPSKLIDGRMAVCNLACEGLSGASATPDLAQRKLYIGGLSPDVTSEMLLNYFGRHGEIDEGSVAYDKDTNESRGFGFVTYKTVEAAKKAIDDPQKILGGRTIIVKLADTHKGKPVQTRLPAAAGYPQPGHLATHSLGKHIPLLPLLATLIIKL